MKKLCLLLAFCLTTIFSAQAETINLANVDKYTVQYEYGGDVFEAVIAQHNDVLTGKLSKTVAVFIGAGATVYLDNVDINSKGDLIMPPLQPISGITCLGDAKIILRNSNIVRSLENDAHAPGILVPGGSTLTIQAEGYGSLDVATSYNEKNNFGAAGIGGGTASHRNAGNIIIKSGIIKATGYIGAGIGAGWGSSCKSITIEGGTITATSVKSGAGIGGGCQGFCGTITIEGGTIIANGEHAAGIGGGHGFDEYQSDYSNCGAINIWGGTITANGNYGAGIGGGYDSSCGTITIQGADVTATGYNAAAIGCGYSASLEKLTCDGITIANGSKIKASTAECPWTIGKGMDEGYTLCGSIVIGGVSYPDGIRENPYTFPYNPCAKAPKNLIITETTYTSATIEWTAPDVQQKQWVVMLKKNNVWWEFITDRTYYTFNNLLPGTQYPVKVAAYCGYDDRSSYTETTINTPAKPVCQAPGKPVLKDVSYNSATISWTAPEDQSVWTVLRKTPDQPAFLWYEISEAKTFTFTNLKPNTTYEVKIQGACDEDNLSDYSPILTFTTEPEPCWAPFLLVGGKSYNSATLEWIPKGSKTPVSYTVRYGKKGGTLSTTTVKTNSITLKSLVPETEYMAQVKAKCSEEDESEYSAYVYFTTPKSGAIVYTEFNNGTITYYYDDKMTTRSGITEEYIPGEVHFKDYYNQVYTVVIDESMKNVPITSAENMFYGGYEGGTDLRLAKMMGVNYLQNLNTSLLTNTQSMFEGCEAMTDVDLRKFDMSHVTNANYMFNGCKKLAKIYCDDDWTQYSFSDESIFGDCLALKGVKGTTYSTSHQNKSWARPDKGTEQPGYFTPDAKQLHSCELKGFDGQFQYGMEWNTAAAKAVAAAITPVDADAPYNISQTTNFLYKWSEEEGKWKLLNKAVTSTLGEGRYYFGIQILIPNEKQDEFYFSPDKEQLSVYVDETQWTVTEMIGTGRSYIALANSYEFTLEKKYDPALEEAWDQLESWTLIAGELAHYFEYKGDYTKAQELTNIATAGQAVLDDEKATLTQINDAIIVTSTAVKPYYAELLELVKLQFIKELEDELQPGDSYACRKIIDDAIAAINAITWDTSKTFEENIELIGLQINAINSQAMKDLQAERKKEQDIDQVTDSHTPTAKKFIQNGQLYIMYKGTMYNVQGQVIDKGTMYNVQREK